MKKERPMPRRNRSRAGAMSALRSSTNALGGFLDAFLDTGDVTEDEFWRQLGDADCQKDLAAKMAERVKAKRGKRGPVPAALPPGHYRANVVHRPLPAGWELLAARAFVWVSRLFDGRGWTDGYALDGREVVVVPGYGPTEFLIKGFKTSMTSEQVIRWADANGWRVATALEAIDFAAAKPGLQPSASIVALGSFAADDGHRHVAVLRLGGRGCELSDDWFDNDWDPVFRFLLVRKSPSR